MANLLLLIIIEFLAVLFLVLGYMVRFRGRTDLLASYRREDVRDPQGLGRFVGTNLLLLGACAVVTFIGILLYPEAEVILFVIFCAGIVPVVSVASALGSRRHLKAN
ncbi:MAG: DUF3784 domain-containing protein [Methanolinea sp.]|jgi:Flp pilus assembly protein TadB|nr:DUF3784 domain-containing protein [Methanolinea sp.]